MATLGNQPVDKLLSSADIIDGSILSVDLANNSITTPILADLNVTNAKLAQAYINDLTTVTFDSATDFVAIADASDSFNKKKALLPAVSAKIQPITATVSTNALTINLPPTTLDFRSATANSGTVTTLSNAAAISMIVPSGAQLGHTNAALGRDIILAINNAGTMEVAVNFSGGGVNLDETGAITTEAITVGCTFTGAIAVTTGILTLTTGLTGALTLNQSLSGVGVNSGTYVIALLSGVQGANGSTYSTNQITAAASTTITGSAGRGIYSTTARTGVAYRVVGYVDSTQATAGTWATAPGKIQGAGGQSVVYLGDLPSISLPTALPAADVEATFSHLLGAVPSSYSISLRNIVAEFGYAVGDEVSVSSNSDGDGARIQSSWANSTVIGYRSSAAATHTIKNRAAAGSIVITSTNWRLIFRAWS